MFENQIIYLMQMYLDDDNFDIFKFLGASTDDKKLSLVIIDDCEAVNDKYKKTKVYGMCIKLIFKILLK